MRMGRLLLALLISAAMLLPVGCKDNEPASSDDKGGAASTSDIEKGGTKTPVVYTSFYTMYDLAGKIGGDKINLINLVPSGVDPHDWEPTAADIAGLESADLFIYNGAEFEHWVEDVLESLSSKKLITVEAAKGIELLNSDDHEGGDHDHGDFDPHVWLSPMNAKAQLGIIEQTLSSADPENAEYYAKNLEKFSAELDKLDKEFSDTLESLVKKDIIVTHSAFGYLCHEYGLNQVPIDGVFSEAEPNPAKMASVIEFAKENDIKVIFHQNIDDAKIAQVIAGELDGGTTMVLNAIEGLTDEQIAAGEDYFSIMRQNLSALEIALK